MRRIRGLAALIHDGVDLTADLVREGMDSTGRIVQRVAEQVEPLAAPVRAADTVRRLSMLAVLGTVKRVNRAVQAVGKVAFDLAELRAQASGSAAQSEALAGCRPLPLPPGAVTMRSDATQDSTWLADAGLGLVNAVVGDHLFRSENELALGLVLRINDQYVAPDRQTLARLLPDASPKVALFVHGLGTTEWSWCLGAEAQHGDAGVHFGALLQRDLGYTPIYVRYNSGRHVSENGRLLAAELERLWQVYPRPIEELVLIGHSMGGLVVRSACHYGQQAGSPWVARVRHVFCLGSPHRGAPLAKIGDYVTRRLAAIDLPGTLIPARILAGRSAGIKDLRHGALLDEDWAARDDEGRTGDEQDETSVPLLPHVRYHFVSATLTQDAAHPLGHILGDLLVRVPSSAGPASRTGKNSVETHHFGGILHHQLQNHPAVYEVLRAACVRS